MNAVQLIDTSRASLLASAIDDACRLIAPSWPLDRQIAVNPYWGMVDQPFADALQAMRRWLGSKGNLWNADDPPTPALALAIQERNADITPEKVVAARPANRPLQPGLPLFSDALDEDRARADHPSWSTTISQQISQYCASYFDAHQADWHRRRDGGFFAEWRNDLEFDHTLLPLMQASAIRNRARDLPATAVDAIKWTLERLGISYEEAPDFLATCLLRINGWASWCAYLAWEARLTGGSDEHLRQLLAIRVSWEAVLHDGNRGASSPGGVWLEAWHRARLEDSSNEPLPDEIWQRAQEITYQNQLIELLTSQPTSEIYPQHAASPSAQLVFCIDVRSERFRRALEVADPMIETRGFAGFFGLPIRLTFLGTTVSRLQLPGLLAATWQATETTQSAHTDQLLTSRRTGKLRRKAVLRTFSRMPSSAFSLVETFGLGYLVAILRRHFVPTDEPTEHSGLTSAERSMLRPQLMLSDSQSPEKKADLVASILRAMGLTSGFARLWVLVGHASQSANNPQKAALDCGACGGQTGEINARVLVGLLNDPALRADLDRRGIHIPATTFAIAALHNTTTDEVQLFDLERAPASHSEEVRRLQVNLAKAGERTRAERASSLGLTHLETDPSALLREICRRARDWAQTRPEWGLAGNAAFIVAPRSRTKHLNLGGRVFLHDYEWQQDSDGDVLELIMTAPMVVAHWINLQYFASTIDPEHFGSGNKLLHNVACGRIGVFEGNTGDLRIGLARQSVHDGNRCMHTPLRLSVFIEAPAYMIEKIIARHEIVRQLIENEWLYLFRLAQSAVIRWRRNTWEAVPA